MILILTHSLDGTTDVIIENLDYPVFRLNIDLWENYEWIIDSEGFIFKDPTGRSINEKDVKCVYFRKLFFNDSNQTIKDRELNWIQSEITHIFRELFNIFYRKNKIALVDPVISRYTGKISQMRIAKKYFSVPDWKIIKGSKISDLFNNTKKNYVVKSLESELLEDDKFLFTKEINIDQLDINIPWLIQEKVSGDDLTVAYINGQSFGYELKNINQTTDWRKYININENNWQKINLSEQLEENIYKFMKELNLKYGRLDFIHDKERLFFLEVNPNGQWGWLDLENKDGLLAEVINELKRIANA